MEENRNHHNDGKKGVELDDKNPEQVGKVALQIENAEHPASCHKTGVTLLETTKPTVVSTPDEHISFPSDKVKEISILEFLKNDMV